MRSVHTNLRHGYFIFLLMPHSDRAIVLAGRQRLLPIQKVLVSLLRSDLTAKGERWGESTILWRDILKYFMCREAEAAAKAEKARIAAEAQAAKDRQAEDARMQKQREAEEKARKEKEAADYERVRDTCEITSVLHFCACLLEGSAELAR